MGRYYSGDIEGKFWFAVQGSDVGERFGAIQATDTATVPYQIEREVFEKNKTMETILNVLGDDFQLFENFFSEHGMYNDNQLKDWFQKNNSTFNENKLKQYADYCFGKQIEEYFNDYPEDDYLWYDAEF